MNCRRKDFGGNRAVQYSALRIDMAKNYNRGYFGKKVKEVNVQVEMG